ncbi:M23 family metallopeptidase [Sphingomonas sp. H39-1-10]|uniref:M23 family metallopeptidase n=1 Tax=Sphingomonas pollutisoli TaxID=3030829 RepID=UPI0023BA2AB4|nr:M23 family metallopeptidase [Sphingomonas pollutisoli]MDF0487409.1 M23 family metallopeptidase [Sphingomonas pollutisoli]
MRRLVLILILLAALLIAAWLGLLSLPDAPTAKAPVSATSAGSEAGRYGPPADATRTGVAALAVPVAGVARGQITDSWGDPRENGARQHHGTDIPAAGGTLVTAAAPGTVEKLFESKAGGTTVYVRSPARDWTYYYAHLAGYAPGLHEGQAVRTGDPLGYVGDTGDAGAGNYHLHFGLTRTTPDQHWYEGEDVDPFPHLTERRVAGSGG